MLQNNGIYHYKIFACSSRNLDYNTTLNNRIPTIVEKIMHGTHKWLIFPQKGGTKPISGDAWSSSSPRDGVSAP